MAEDDDFLVLEVVKDMGRELQVHDGDRFLTLAFLHQTTDEAGQPYMASWLPWQDDA